MDFTAFTETEFQCRPEEYKGEVYVFLFVAATGETPFYVGQTSRFLGRMDDYFWSSFAASTDFKVGEAIRYFSQHHRVIVRHKLSDDRFAEERKVIDQLTQEGAPLLNNQRELNYDYRVNTREAIDAIRLKVHAWCERALKTEYPQSQTPSAY